MSDKRLATLANFSKPYSLLWATVLPKYRCKSLQTLPKYFDVTPCEVAMQILFSLWYSPDVVLLPHRMQTPHVGLVCVTLLGLLPSTSSLRYISIDVIFFPFNI